ncbi:MAG: ArsR family transcriptional regulator [Phycisphaerales bacterium]|nr:ArsR family transcriptional regulator [Phycisphaerales bacterium]
MSTRPTSDALTQAQDQFVAVWGQMGSAWGISRTMAEVHALLYITGEPLCTDDIMERLEISRGNASMSLRALLEWGIVSRTHKRGDRKEYFQAEQHVWTLFRAIVRERIKREVDPLMASLYEIRDITQPHQRADARPSFAPPAAIADHNRRLDEMIDFFRTLETLSQGFVSPSGRGLEIAASVLSGSVTGPRAAEPARPGEGESL